MSEENAENREQLEPFGDIIIDDQSPADELLDANHAPAGRGAANSPLEKQSQLPDQDKLNDLAKKHVSPLEKTVEQQAEEEFAEGVDKLSDKLKDDQKRQEVREQVRLIQIKANKDVTDSAPAFLRDMSGFAPFEKTYDVTPWLSVVFCSMKASEVEEISKQNVRDAITGRYQFTDEARFNTIYRLASSLSSLTLRDPQSKQIMLSYDRSVDSEQYGEFRPKEYNQTYDLPVRKRALYLTEKLLESGLLYNMVIEQFQKFELLLSDLMFLVFKDPDFFYSCLDEES